MFNKVFTLLYLYLIQPFGLILAYLGHLFKKTKNYFDFSLFQDKINFYILKGFEFREKSAFYIEYMKRQDDITNAICIGALGLIFLKFVFALYFTHYAPFYINLFILSLGSILAYKFDLMKTLKYYIGWWFWKYGYYSLFSEEALPRLAMIGYHNMEIFFKPTWFRLLEDFFIFLIYIRLIARIEPYLFMVIRFVVFSLLLANKLFLLTAILSLINIGGRILYNFSYSNTEIDDIKQTHLACCNFIDEELPVYIDKRGVKRAINIFYIKPTWHNATLMYLVYTLDRIALRYTYMDTSSMSFFDVMQMKEILNLDYLSEEEWDELQTKPSSEMKSLVEPGIENLVQPGLLSAYERRLWAIEREVRLAKELRLAPDLDTDFVRNRMCHFFIPIQYFNPVVDYKTFDTWYPPKFKLNISYNKNYIFKLLSLSLLSIGLLYINYKNNYYDIFMHKIILTTSSLCKNKSECHYITKDFKHRMEPKISQEMKLKIKK